MRSVFISLVCVFSLVLAGCGDGSGIVGTWVPDMDAMKADIDTRPTGAGVTAEEAIEALRKNRPDAPDGDMRIQKWYKAWRRAWDQKQEEAEKARMADLLDGMTVEVKRDGTYVRSAGGKAEEKGTWKLEGSKLIVRPSGLPAAMIFSPPRIATYERGKITFKPDGTPHSISMTVVLKKK